jgi:catalase
MAKVAKYLFASRNTVERILKAMRKLRTENVRCFSCHPTYSLGTKCYGLTLNLERESDDTQRHEYSDDTELEWNMSIDPKTRVEKEKSRFFAIRTLPEVVVIVVVLATIVGMFAYAGGWFTPKNLTPERFVDAFEQVDGVHPGFRRNHAKGVCVSGFFESNGNGVRISKAVVFQKGHIPVIGRFSLSGGQPHGVDEPNAVRGLALQFSLPDGEFWRTAMINLPVFPVRTPEAFYERLLASKPDPQTGKSDPAKLKEFLDRHPETAEAIKIIKGRPPSSGFGNSTFRSLNAFLFSNSAGETIPVRWLLAPVRPFEEANPNAIPQNKNYLFDELIEEIHHQPLQWRLIVIVGHRDDPTNDATIAWPETCEKVDVGTLTLDRVESEEKSEATDINFDPLVLPVGIAPSDDPLLSARSAVYSRSFTKRSGETKQPSAITESDVRKGE